jgi:hypothetical protein
MDKNFLEMWGTFLINMAKGQQQMDDMAKWMSGGMTGVPEMTEMFKRFYGLSGSAEKTPDYTEAWKTASEQFQKAFRDHLRSMGMVPKDEHLKIVKKYEALKEKLAESEETVAHLRMLLNERNMDQGEVMRHFQGLMDSQSDQFSELMTQFQELYGQSGETEGEE